MHVTPSPSTSAPVVLPPLAPGYAWTLTPHGWCPAPYDGPPLAPVPAPRPTTPATPQAVLRAALFDLAARDPHLARAAARMLAKVWQRPSTAPPAPLVPATSSPATPPPRLDAAQLDAAAQLRERDPTVARALAAHVETTEHAQTAAETFAAALDRHGAGPDEPTARATWVRTLADHDRDVAIALAAALATVEATEHTAAQLDAALAPYAARAPPLRAPFDA